MPPGALPLPFSLPGRKAHLKFRDSRRTILHRPAPWQTHRYEEQVSDRGRAAQDFLEPAASLSSCALLFWLFSFGVSKHADPSVRSRFAANWPGYTDATRSTTRIRGRSGARVPRINYASPLQIMRSRRNLGRHAPKNSLPRPVYYRRRGRCVCITLVVRSENAGKKYLERGGALIDLDRLTQT